MVLFRASALYFGATVAGAALFCLLLTLEAIPKRGLVDAAEGDKALSPEEEASFLQRLFLVWLDPLLLRGYRTTLRNATLGPVNNEFEAAQLYAAAIPHWERYRKAGASYPLIRTLFAAFGWRLLAPIFPSVLWALAQIAQATLVGDVLSFVQSYQTPTPQPAAFGYGLIAATALVFAIFNIAHAWADISIVSSSAVVRGVLIELIFHKTLKLHIDEAKEIGAGASTSLMSIDTERIVQEITSFHLTYTTLIMIAIGLLILYEAIGISFVATVIGAVFFFFIIPVLARGIGTRLRKFAEATDRRIKLMSSILRSIQAVKLAGYEPLLIRKLCELRAAEVNALKQWLIQLLVISCATNVRS